MGKQKKTRKFAEVKRMLNPKDIEWVTLLGLCLRMDLYQLAPPFVPTGLQRKSKRLRRRKKFDMCK